MPNTGPRPIARARNNATKALVSKYQDEFDALVHEEMKSLGYVEQTRTITKWVKPE